MRIKKAGAIALIIGSVATMMLMAIHPAHGDGGYVAGFSLVKVVHAIAILTTPLLVFGFCCLSHHLEIRRPLVMLAFSYYLLGAIAVLMAATISGLVTSEVMGVLHGSHMKHDAMQSVGLKLSVLLNRAFAQVHVALLSIAYALFALAWPKALSYYMRLFRIWGCVIGLGVLVWQVSGHFAINVHSMNIVVIVQGVWVIAAALIMLHDSWQDKT